MSPEIEVCKERALCFIKNWYGLCLKTFQKIEEIIFLGNKYRLSLFGCTRGQLYNRKTTTNVIYI